MSEDFVNSLRINETTGNLHIALFDPLVANKVDSVFTSMFRNRVTNQKINQMALVQVASVGLDNSLKLVFKSQEFEEGFKQDLVESEKIITFAKLEADVKDLIEKKGYTEELWNTLTEKEKEHAIKCATI